MMMITESIAEGKSSNHKLDRVTFKTSREMDFFSEKELVTQTGHSRDEWPLVIVKELMDNALDACEEAEIAPVLTVTADPAGITVTDNGPGLPEDTLRAALDFTIRASNREAYVSPCRGAQGNALKTLLPMPYVLDPEHGRLVITAHGRRHDITCGADPISQRPVITDAMELAKSKNSYPQTDERKLTFSGTSVRLEWMPKEVASSTSAERTWLLWPFWNDGWYISTPATFRALVEGFAVFNPHATITLDWFGDRVTWPTTDPAWEKWKPHQPTSSHWYEQRHMERLIGAYITHEREVGIDRLVSEFIAEFDGLTGSPKRTKVLTEAGLKRALLSEFVKEGRLDSERIGHLLAAMKRHSRPVAARLLGPIGEDHLRKCLLAMGVMPESFRYEKKLSDRKSKKSKAPADEKACFPSLPYVLESAFGYLGEKAKDERRIYAGANWSAAIKNPFRSFGSTGEGLETHLSNLMATRGEPVVFVLHLAHPRVEYTDRGKTALAIGGAA